MVEHLLVNLLHHQPKNQQAYLLFDTLDHLESKTTKGWAEAHFDLNCFDSQVRPS